MPRARLLATCAFVSIAALALAACPVEDPTIEQVIPWNTPLDQGPDEVDVSYGPGAIRALDVYETDAAPSGVAIVYLHSGGWSAGDKSAASATGITQWLLDQGHTILSANYTLTSGSSSGFPANIDDVKWAVAWANQPAQKAQYGYSKVVVGGTSAGGHLAMLAATSSHAVPADMPAGMDVRPDGGISWSGPIDITTFGDQTDFQRDTDAVKLFWGSNYSDPDQIPLLARIAASPQFFVDPGDPPVFMTSSEFDGYTPSALNADVLEQAYIDAGPGTNHAWNDVIEGSEDHNATFANIAAADLFLRYIASGEL